MSALDLHILRSRLSDASSASQYTFSPGRESWIAITTVVLSLTLSHLVQRIKAKRTIRRARHQGNTSDLRFNCSAFRVGYTWTSAIRIRVKTYLYLYVLPPWLYAPETVCDAIWTLSYCGVMIALAVYQCPFTPKEYPYLYLANRLGILSYTQTPLIFLLAAKNNPLSPLIGITYQKLNYLHRASARLCIIFAWVHAGLWFLPVLYAGHLFHWYIIWGTIALVSFTLLWGISIRSIRRRSFEFFLVAHILFSAAFIFGAILHWPLQAYWIWPAMAIWAIDRLIRLFRLISNNQLHRRRVALPDDCQIEVVSKDVMRLTLVRPGLKWKAGQHFFLSSPDTGCMAHESHPFTIANIPNPDNRLIFLVRAHDGFTRRLYQSTHLSPKIRVEGPYGHSHSLNHFNTILLISGGTGITFTLSHLLSLLSHVQSDKGIAKRLKLVWHVRHAEDVYWISGMLDEALRVEGKDEERMFGNVDVDVEVWVTRGHRSFEPWTGENGVSPTSSSESGSRIGPGMSGGYGCAGVSSMTSGDSGRVREMTEVNEMTRLLPNIGTRTRDPSQGYLAKKDASIRDESICSPCPVQTRSNPYRSPSTISPAIQRILSVHAGRADITLTTRQLADRTDSDPAREGRGMIVVACGPVQLMHDTRKAVGQINGWRRIRHGGSVVNYLEETVGH